MKGITLCEDVGLCLGQALRKLGLFVFRQFRLNYSICRCSGTMDDTLAFVAIDISGDRILEVWESVGSMKGCFLAWIVEFLRAFSFSARLNTCRKDTRKRSPPYCGGSV